MKLPHKFGKYVLVSKIAQGGMAEVFRAKYLGEGGFVKDVAIKRILPNWSENKEFVAMLCDEAKALVKLQHQNIVQIYELGKDEDAFYISMEYIQGVDLRRFFRKILSEEPPHDYLKYVCFVIQEILKALSFAHHRTDTSGDSLGIIHRDISPQNILLSFNGEVKVVDFGIAKGKHRSFETAVTQVKGKYAYMSPEQATGLEIDARTDLYSVGVILYEFLKRRRLYNAPNDLLTIEEVKKSVLPEGWEGGILEGLQSILEKALQRLPEERYQSASEFLKEINEFVVKNNLVTHGNEISGYLRDIFKGEYIASIKEEETPVEFLDEPRRETKILVRPPKKRRAWRYWAGAAVAIAIIIGFGVHRFITVSAVSAVSAVKAEKIEERKPIAKTGTLSVQARPWGQVYISGYLRGTETPVDKIKIKSGLHTLKVHYEPENKWVEKEIDIAANSATACIATFDENPAINCK